MLSINKEIKETRIPERIRNAIGLEVSVTLTYGVLVSLTKLFNLDPQNVNADFLQYLKSAYTQSAPYFMTLFPIGYFLPEISKGIIWAANLPMRWGGKGIDYISRLRS